MSLARRLNSLESATKDFELRRQAARMAAHFGIPATGVDDIVTRGHEIQRRLDQLQATGLDDDGALRAWTEEQGLDYDEFIAELEKIPSAEEPCD